MSALLECGNCGVCEVVSLSDALAAGWQLGGGPDPQQPVSKGVWTCPSVLPAQAGMIRIPHP